MPLPRAMRRHVPDTRYRYGFFGRYLRVVGGLLVASVIASAVIATRLYEAHICPFGDCLSNAELVTVTQRWFGVNPSVPAWSRGLDYFLGIIGSWPVLLTLAVFGLLVAVPDWTR